MNQSGLRILSKIIFFIILGLSGVSRGQLWNDSLTVCLLDYLSPSLLIILKLFCQVAEAAMGPTA
jgi:hypothetical protein